MRTLLGFAVAISLTANVWAQEPSPPLDSTDIRATLKASDLPEMDGVAPFSADSHYLSLAGALRWRLYEHSGVWLTLPEASLAVQEQAEAEAAGR